MVVAHAVLGILFAMEPSEPVPLEPTTQTAPPPSVDVDPLPSPEPGTTATKVPEAAASTAVPTSVASGAATHRRTRSPSVTRTVAVPPGEERPWVKPPRPDVDEGRDLLFGGIALQLLGTPLIMVQAVLVDGCGDEIRAGKIANNALHCAMHHRRNQAVLGLHALSVGTNLAGAVVLTKGGVQRGHYAAVDTAWGVHRRLRANAWIGVGVATSVLGLVGIAALPAHIYRPCQDGDCGDQLRSYLFYQQLSHVMFSTGAMLVGFGFSYKSAMRQYDRHLRRTGTLRLAPQLTAGGAGLTLSGRF